MSIHHLTIAVRGRLALARDEAERRALVRTLVRIAADRMILFNVLDDHLHAVLRGERARRLAEGLRRALISLRPDLELKTPHLEPVGTRAYLRSLVGYVLRQTDEHGLGVSSALWTGSCFQDLAGARWLPGFNGGPLREELPRLQSRELFELVGLTPEPLAQANDDALVRVGVARLVELAAGVFAVDPALTDNTPASVRARVLAARLGRDLDQPTSQIARFLGVVPRAARDLAARDVDPEAVAALRRRLTLEVRVAARAPMAPR
jgi:hypothetical protein